MVNLVRRSVRSARQSWGAFTLRVQQGDPHILLYEGTPVAAAMPALQVRQLQEGGALPAAEEEQVQTARARLRLSEICAGIWRNHQRNRETFTVVNYGNRETVALIPVDWLSSCAHHIGIELEEGELDPEKPNTGPMLTRTQEQALLNLEANQFASLDSLKLRRSLMDTFEELSRAGVASEGASSQGKGDEEMASGFAVTDSDRFPEERIQPFVDNGLLEPNRDGTYYRIVKPAPPALSMTTGRSLVVRGFAEPVEDEGGNVADFIITEDGLNALRTGRSRKVRTMPAGSTWARISSGGRIHLEEWACYTPDGPHLLSREQGKWKLSIAEDGEDEPVELGPMETEQALHEADARIQGRGSFYRFKKRRRTKKKTAPNN